MQGENGVKVDPGSSFSVRTRVFVLVLFAYSNTDTIMCIVTCFLYVILFLSILLFVLEIIWGCLKLFFTVTVGVNVDSNNKVLN